MRTYNVLIVEDEIPAQINLQRAIERNFDDMAIIGTESSVEGTISRLQGDGPCPDIIFMDVELSDGMCFDIFSRVEIRSKVIITTAYDNYAVKAFRMNTIDYLLKPINTDELKAAVERCRVALEQSAPAPALDLAALRSALTGEEPAYKKRFIIKLGDHISVVETSRIAYFYAENKSTYLVTSDNHRHILDTSLDNISEQIDPDRFFRISRNCAVAIDAITDISKHLGNRLKLQLRPAPYFDIYVSRSRSNDFLNWLEGK